MKFIKETNWQDVFEGWRMREASNPGWIDTATRIKGWSNWESWRSFTAEQIHASERKWSIYEFVNPMQEIPEMLIGPYSGWQSRVANANKTNFKELLDIPEQYRQFSEHSGVLAILRALPFMTEFIGLIRKDINKIVCIEGHHRATAIALAKKQGTAIDFSQTPVTIALTELAVENSQLLDDVLKRGTSKIPQSSSTY